MMHKSSYFAERGIDKAPQKPNYIHKHTHSQPRHPQEGGMTTSPAEEVVEGEREPKTLTEVDSAGAAPRCARVGTGATNASIDGLEEPDDKKVQSSEWNMSI
jgi:hypothetical protein